LTVQILAQHHISNSSLSTFRRCCKNQRWWNSFLCSKGNRKWIIYSYKRSNWFQVNMDDLKGAGTVLMPTITSIGMML
jgi:uncharacterized protein YggE